MVKGNRCLIDQRLPRPQESPLWSLQWIELVSLRLKIRSRLFFILSIYMDGREKSAMWASVRGQLHKSLCFAKKATSETIIAELAVSLAGLRSKFDNKNLRLTCLEWVCNTEGSLPSWSCCTYKRVTNPRPLEWPLSFQTPEQRATTPPFLSILCSRYQLFLHVKRNVTFPRGKVESNGKGKAFAEVKTG